MTKKISKMNIKTVSHMDLLQASADFTMQGEENLSKATKKGFSKSHIDFIKGTNQICKALIEDFINAVIKESEKR